MLLSSNSAGQCLQDHAHSPSLQLSEHLLPAEHGRHDKLKKFAWARFLLGTVVQVILHEHDILQSAQAAFWENLR
jgi:hypothetical protein